MKDGSLKLLTMKCPRICKGAFSYILKFMLLTPLSEISVVVQGGTDRTIYLFAVGSPKKRGET